MTAPTRSRTPVRTPGRFPGRFPVMVATAVLALAACAGSPSATTDATVTAAPGVGTPPSPPPSPPANPPASLVPSPVTTEVPTDVTKSGSGGSTSPEPASSAPAPRGPLAFLDALEPDDGAWSQPYGVDVDSDGNTWVLDTGNHRLLAFDVDGRQVVEVGGRGSDPGQFDTLGFGALAVGPDDEVFVVDNGNGRIQVFGPDGAFRREWGALGDDPGQFRRAIGIAVDDAGDVYVTDDERPEVQVFDVAGTVVGSFGVAGDGPAGLVHATGVDVDGTGRAWVADYEARRVQAFDLADPGDDPPAWEIPGPLGTTGIPEGIVALDDGRVWVTSYDGGEVLQLPVDRPTTSGQDGDGAPQPWPLVAGGEGIGDGTLQAPVDLAVAPDGTLVVTDQQANTVQRFRAPG